MKRERYGWRKGGREGDIEEQRKGHSHRTEGERELKTQYSMYTKQTADTQHISVDGVVNCHF